jgi:lipopolysaccharide/colanic/teichoic acid biosynthesis glycosyltransferase
MSVKKPAVVISDSWYRAAKDFIELCIALALFLVALPVMAVLVLLVKLTSRGPAFYSQVRLGKDGRPFRIWKLRTMKVNAESGTGAVWAKPGDTRITWIGRILRKTHLDELPQLWNVLRGEMSLVGPRPERPEFVPSLEKAIPLYRERLLVRPGVTGLAQVQLPADTDLSSVRSKIAYDLFYIRTFDLWLDVRLMLSTGLHMFGVPYRTLCWMFAIPRQEAVEAAYAEQLQQHDRIAG